MKKTEKVLTILMLTGAVMVYTDVAGGSILVTFPGLILSLLYFPLGFVLFNGISLKGIFKKISYAGTTTMDIVQAVIAGFVLSQALICVLYVVLHWTNMNLMGNIGLASSLICVLYAIVMLLLRKKKLHREVLIRSVVIAIAIILGHFLFKDISYVEREQKDFREFEQTHRQ